jgi:hypothetical protein
MSCRLGGWRWLEVAGGGWRWLEAIGERRRDAESHGPFLGEELIIGQDPTERRSTIGRQIRSWTDKVRFRSDKVRFRSDKVRFRSDKVRFRSDKVRVRSDKVRFRSDKVRVRSDKVRFRSDKVRFQSDISPMSDSVRCRTWSDNVLRRSGSMSQRSPHLAANRAGTPTSLESRSRPRRTRAESSAEPMSARCTSPPPECWREPCDPAPRSHCARASGACR